MAFKSLKQRKQLRKETGMGPLTRTAKMEIQKEALNSRVPLDYNKKLATIKGIKQRINYENSYGFLRELTPEEARKVVNKDRLPPENKSVKQNKKVKVVKIALFGGKKYIIAEESELKATDLKK